MSLFKKLKEIKVQSDCEHIYRDSLSRIHQECITKQIQEYGSEITQLTPLLDGDQDLASIDFDNLHKNMDVLFNDKRTL